MERHIELQIIRRAYAKQIMAIFNVLDAQVEAAFAAVPREDYLGPGPWPICRAMDVYVPTPTADPVYLYSDNLVGIAPERNLNNGQPSLHALLLEHAKIKPGEHVVHIGAGLGYYSAIMAHLAGPSGKVTAIEVDADLASRAASHLSALTTVRVVHADGGHFAFDKADVIYVNAGATRPTDLWLDRLKNRGRLILPLTANEGIKLEPSQKARRGAVFCIERQEGSFPARCIAPVAIYPCEGARDEDSEAALSAAFDKGSPLKVTKLYRSGAIPKQRCWVRGTGWCLAYE
jgi:protein-L-isoaspartate(D-aspartate) O-methyltransferase